MTSENGAHHGRGALATSADVTGDLLNRHRETSDRFWQVVAVFGVLFILGIIGFFIRLSDGFGVSDKIFWGYYAATFAFILTTAQAARSPPPRCASRPRRRG